MIVLFITNYLLFTIKHNGLPHNNQFKLNRSPYNINKHQTFFNLFLNDLFILSQLFAALPKIVIVSFFVKNLSCGGALRAIS